MRFSRRCLLVFGCTLFALLAATPVTAQTQPVGNAEKLLLREGVDVPLIFADDLSSKTAAEGDPVSFTLGEDLKVGDVVVARAGCKAFGEITNVKGGVKVSHRGGVKGDHAGATRSRRTQLG